MKSLNVALLYNQKREDDTQQLVTEESTEPPSTITSLRVSSTTSVQLNRTQERYADAYAEWDTAETIQAVQSALEEIHNVTLIEADEQAYEKLRLERPDIVFNMAEGLHGVSREAQMPAILEFLQIPYTGSDPLTLATCLDKARTKEILSYGKIPTPNFILVNNLQKIPIHKLRFPCVVKPVHEGSSKGIYNSSLVQTKEELYEEVARVHKIYEQPALVEEFLPGREFTVALLGNGDNLVVLPIVEIKFESLPPYVNPLYSYEAKWIWDQAKNPLDIFECPANLTPSLKQRIEKICRDAFHLLRCRDWCRIDVRLDAKENPHILELNPLPGILPKPEDNSCFPKAARAAGLSYNQLIQTVLAIAAIRYKLYKPTHKKSITN